jgi:hypothetical protein
MNDLAERLWTSFQKCWTANAYGYDKKAFIEFERVVAEAQKAINAARPEARSTDVETVLMLLDGFKDDSPVSEVRAMLKRQFGMNSDGEKR